MVLGELAATLELLSYFPGILLLDVGTSSDYFWMDLDQQRE